MDRRGRVSVCFELAQPADASDDAAPASSVTIAGVIRDYGMTARAEAPDGSRRFMERETMTRTSRTRRAMRWLFADRAGDIVIGQTPNALGLLVVAFHAARIGPRRDARATAAVRRLGTASLALWALDELVCGVNPFRRIGGAVVLGAIVSTRRRRFVRSPRVPSRRRSSPPAAFTHR